MILFLFFILEFEIDEEDDVLDDLPTPVAMNSKILDDDDALYPYVKASFLDILFHKLNLSRRNEILFFILFYFCIPLLLKCQKSKRKERRLEFRALQKIV